MAVVPTQVAGWKVILPCPMLPQWYPTNLALLSYVTKEAASYDGAMYRQCADWKMHDNFDENKLQKLW